MPGVNIEARAEEEVVRASVSLLLKEPFYAHVLAGVTRSFSEKVDTLGVTIRDSNLALFINPEFFIKQLRKDERVAVLKHEILHLVLRHLFHPLGKAGEDSLFNIAADLVVNQYVRPWPLPEGSVTIAMFPELGLEPGQALEYYYKKLKTLTSSSGCDGDSGIQVDREAFERCQSNVPTGSHQQWRVVDSAREAIQDELYAANIDACIERARQRCDAKNWAALPGDIQRAIDDACLRQAPRVDWRRTLRLFASSGCRTRVAPTKKRLSKRFNEFPGIRIKRLQRIAVVIDTSGSIGQVQLECFFNEIHAIWKSGADVTVVEADADVQRSYPYQGVPLTQVMGGGGTDFSPALEWVKNTKNGVFDICIYLTDGFADRPGTKPRCPVLWVITPEGSTEAVSGTGRVVVMKENAA